MERSANKTSKKGLLVLLVIVLVIAIALAVYFFVGKEENRDYTDEETYIGLSETKAVERAQKSGLEYDIVDQNEQYPEARGILGTVELILYESDGKIVDANYRGDQLEGY